MKITAIILTFNEEKHIERCILSTKKITENILVVDSLSSDATVALAKANGAQVLQHSFVTHADQFNWALNQVSNDTQWILRIDADEYFDDQLVKSILNIPAHTETNGYYINRRMIFQGKNIKYGLVYPVRILRLLRNGQGRCVERMMDEHIEVNGLTETLTGTLFDHNLGSLTWWTNKHNRYSSLEAVEQLNREHGFLKTESIPPKAERISSSMKRWLKSRIYNRLPFGLRAFAYFIFRYIFALGFLDGKSGTTFHFLQGFWYRYLVDAKIFEINRIMNEQNLNIKDAIHRVLDIKIP